jgi:hypothetical protein
MRDDARFRLAAAPSRAPSQMLSLLIVAYCHHPPSQVLSHLLPLLLVTSRYFSLLLEPPSQAPVQVQTKGLRERAEEQRAIDRERELLEAERVQHRAEEDALRLKQARERAAEEEMRAAEREVVALLGFRCFGVSVFRSSVVRDWGLGFFFFRGFVDSPSS